MKSTIKTVLSLSAVLSLSVSCLKEEIHSIDNDLFDKYQHSFTICSAIDLRHYFSYNGSNDIIICGHRGGSYSDYPENCLETFDRLLYTGPIFFEVDPRITKDEKIVLMHDATLSRTTSLRGYVSDYTFEELKSAFLVDVNGKKTTFHIPLLSDVIKWSQGRTILNFDQKDVPPKMICDLLSKMQAKNCIFTVHSVQEAKDILLYDPEMCFSAFIGTVEKFHQYDSAGMLPHIVIAYLESTEVSDAELVSLLHSRGIRCMISTAPVENEPPSKIVCDYFVSMSPDIIESNYPANYMNNDKVRKNWL